VIDAKTQLKRRYQKCNSHLTKTIDSNLTKTISNYNFKLSPHSHTIMRFSEGRLPTFNITNKVIK